MPIRVYQGGLGAAQQLVTPTVTSTSTIKSALGPTTLVKPTTTQLTPIAPPMSLPPPRPAPVPITPMKTTALAPTAAPKTSPAPAPTTTTTSGKQAPDGTTRAQEFTKETAVTADRDPTKQPGYEPPPQEPPPREHPGSHGEPDTTEPSRENTLYEDDGRLPLFLPMDEEGDQEIMRESLNPAGGGPARRQGPGLLIPFVALGSLAALYWFALRKPKL